MAKNDVELEVTLIDNASKKIKQVENASKQASKAMADEAERAGNKQKQAAEKTAQAVENAHRRSVHSVQNLANARQNLGVRSEHQIQREIQRTVASYNRLRASGTASSRELAKAASAVRAQLNALNAEMGKTSMGQRLGNVGRAVAGATVGIGVGISQIARPIRTTADYNLTLAYLANTAYSDRDNAGRQAGMDNIHKTIKDSVTKYGGSKETAMEALSSLVSQGKVSVDTALNLLPTIQKNATATGASTADIAGLVNAGLGYGIQEEQIQDFLDYANASGKAGGFELRDMAQYAPMLFSAAKGAGLSGMDGAKEMFKILQQVFNVSGGSSETVTNTMGFLSKLNSQDTINRAKKLEIYDPKDKKMHGLDLETSMAARIGKGESPVQAFLGIVDDVMAKDTEYQQLQKALQNAQGDAEKTAVLNRLADYMQGTKLGELVADRQAWLGMYGVRSQSLTANNVEDAYRTAIGGTEKDWSFIEGQAAVKMQRAENTVEMGKMEAFNSLTETTGDLAQKLADYGAEYPNLTKYLAGAGESVQAFGSAVASSAGTMWLYDLLKGRATGGAVTTATTTATTGAGVSGAAIARVAGVVGVTTMLTGDDAEAQKRNTDFRAALDAVDAGTATQEQEKRIYEYNKGVVNSYENHWFTRLITSDESIEQSRRQIADYEAKYQTGYSGLSTSFGKTQPWTSTVGDLSQLGSTLSNLSGLGRSQNDFQAFGQQISAGLKQAVESQNFTIQNEIKVDLDGRIVAEQTSHYQYQDLKRGI